MTNKYLINFILFTLLLICENPNAQVTIGSDLSPSKGSLLDIKEFSTTDPKSSSGSTAEKGVVMPRVNLTDLNSLSDLISGTITQTMNESHSGLTIYNVNRTETFCPGLFVWDGTKWNPMTGNDPITYTAADVNNPNSYIVTSGAKQSIPVSKLFAVWDTYSSRLGGEVLATNCVQAILLWEDTNGLISNTDAARGWVLPIQNGSIKIETTAGLYGNAVIAVRIGNTIRWSWHVWIPDGDPRTNTLATNNGQTGGNYVWMDRNLGAHKTSPEDQNNDGIRTFGLLYQWGRKDPFPSSRGVKTATVDGNTTIPLYGYQTTVITDSIATPSDVRNFRASIFAPLGFIKSTSAVAVPWDWYTITSANQWNDLWGYNSGKTPFDPCPQGWRVPTYKGTALTPPWNGSTFAAANFPINLTAVEWTSAGTNLVTGRGRTTNTTPRHFYPTPALRSNTSGAVSSPGNGARIWTAMPDIGSYGGRHIMWTSNDANVQTMGGSSRASGYSVRCVAE